MRCEQVRGELWRLVDAGLGESAQERLAEHVAECEVCRGELTALRELDAALAGEPSVDAPRGMAAEVARRAAARVMVRRRLAIPAWLEGLTFAGVCGAGAAAALVAAVALGGAEGLGLAYGSAVGVLGAAVAAAVFGVQYYES